MPINTPLFYTAQVSSYTRTSHDSPTLCSAAPVSDYLNTEESVLSLSLGRTSMPYAWSNYNLRQKFNFIGIPE
ncbi:hypothetical protein KEM48_008077 [Puccinia striiformis f. sp. tritici PST-130]|nr:hypothetical protein H4Q26_008367 [Puccinia striiformis f. sp. tritici PST-130]KAI9620540.1 hypothetical protein KEM48_008077 [Puccinia striiformis f. sp. tritici PST-130]